MKEVDWVSCIVRGSSLTPGFRGKGDTGVCRMRGTPLYCGVHAESPAHTWGGHFRSSLLPKKRCRQEMELDSRSSRAVLRTGERGGV